MKAAAAFAGCLAALACPAAAAREPNSCEAVVRALHYASDWQMMELFEPLVWPDGYSQWPGQPKPQSWANVRMWGPHPKYRTYIRGMRVIESGEAKRVLVTKEISLRLSMQEYTGDYTVRKSRYTCLKRGGQWRVLSRLVTSRHDAVNERAAREFRRINRD